MISRLKRKTFENLYPLFPFQGGLLFDMRRMKIYLKEIRATSTFKTPSLEQFLIDMAKAKAQGLIDYAPTSNRYHVQSQPIFCNALKNNCRKSDRSAYMAILQAFTRYYQSIGDEYGRMIDSNDPLEQLTGIRLMQYEYENFLFAISMAVKNKEQFESLLISINSYLDKINGHEEKITLLTSIRNRIIQERGQNYFLKLPSEFLEINRSLVNSYLTLSQYDHAEEELQKALRALQDDLHIKSDQLSIHRGRLLQSLGNLYTGKGELANGQAHFEQALLEYKKGNDRKRVAQVAFNLAFILKEQRDYHGATAYAQQSLVVFEQGQDIHRIAQTYQLLGLIALEKGQHDHAIELLKKALASFEEHRDHRNIGRINHNIGALMVKQQKYEEASVFFKAALQYYITVQDSNLQALVIQNLGVVHEYQNMFDIARDYYARALIIYRKLKVQQGEAQILHNLANIYLAENNYLKAKELNQQALAIFDGLNDTPKQGVVQLHLGILSMKEATFAEAKKYLDLSLENLITSNDSQNLILLFKTIQEYSLATSEQTYLRKAFERFIANADLEQQIRQQVSEVIGKV